MAFLPPLKSLSFLLSLLTLLTTHPSSASLPPQMSPQLSIPQESHHRSSLLAPILSNLGFEELAMAVPALYSPVLSSWSGPITIFAPSDDSISSCSFCSTPRLLREHIVPGLFSRAYLSKLAYGTKLETASPGRCLTITKAVNNSGGSNGLDRDPDEIKIFVDGVEITDPDLFNDRQIVVHGIRSFVAPLSFGSCAQEPLPSKFSPEIDGHDRESSAIMRLMLRDAMLRLRDGGYNILALAMRVKYPELAGLNNMTVFTLNDHAIFAGGNGYLSNVRFHVVPNRILVSSDLMRLRQGTVLPTLVRGQHLVVTQAGFGARLSSASVRINYVPIKELDVVYNAKIVVHRIFLPFPHLYLANHALDTPEREMFASEIESCEDGKAVGAGECYSTPAAAPAAWDSVDLDEGF